MVFNSDVFFVFAALFFPLYFMMNTARAQNWLTLGASYLFYGWWDWRFLALIGFSTLFNFYVVRKVMAKPQGTGHRAQNAGFGLRWPSILGCWVSLNTLGFSSINSRPLQHP